MRRFKSILAATDFSPDAAHALRRAARLAERHAARLTLLHVVDDTGFKALRAWFSPSIDHDLKVAQARAALRGFAAEIRGRHRVPARFRVVIGDPFREIQRAAEGADLVVLGPRGRNPLSLVTGSTADRLLRACRRPTLVVKQAAERAYRRVLVPVDFTPHASACLQAAGALAPDTELHVFHALEDSSRDFEMRLAGVPGAVIRDHERAEVAQAQSRVRAMAAQAGLAPNRVRASVRCGPAWACTLEQADALGSDLIVVAKRDATMAADFLLGSFTRRMLASSTCDLLVLPVAATAGRPAGSAASGEGTLPPPRVLHSLG